MIVHHLYISPDHNFYGHHGKPAGEHPVIECDAIDLVAGSGIVGDRFFDYKPDYKGQITFFDHAVYQQVRDEIVRGELAPSAFRRNVVVSGGDLNSLIGQRFRIGELEFTGSSECSPCYWMDQACAPGTEAFLKGRGGLRARITAGGTLTTGKFELELV
ncbi:MOSC domain-containing protein [Sulfuriroseicoccus oceanibius]|uniref:MOSC domain-containing protein n=1 Tax=Sulfuriroseicoccus oceanibius TaxID=2707525 RepID=A0A7T7F3Y9_9BACT|nr:MOSC domain-containing protein [Sulfuriroseicoccus oceanibius]